MSLDIEEGDILGKLSVYASQSAYSVELRSLCFTSRSQLNIAGY